MERDEELGAVADAVAAECLRGTWWRADGSGKWLATDWRPFTSKVSLAFIGVVPHRIDGELALAVLFRAAPHWEVVWAYPIGLDEQREDLGWPRENRHAIAREELFDLWEDIASGAQHFGYRPTASTATTVASVGTVHWVAK